MNRFILSAILLTFYSLPGKAQNTPHHESPGDHTLFYKQPATKWSEALPVGNGRLGAMVFSHPGKERIQLNEDSMWPGENGWDLAEGNPKDLQEIRQLLIDGKNKMADSLFVEKFLTKDITRSHQTMGDLWINFKDSTYTDYSRSLNLKTAELSSVYKINGKTVRQQVISSFPDDVLIIRYATESKEGLTASITISRPDDQGHQTARSFVEDGSLVMQGEVTQYQGRFKGKIDPITSGVQFDTRVKAVHKGGKVEYTENSIELKNVEEVTIYLVANTSYYHADFAAKSKRQIEKVSSRSFSKIHKAHVADHSALFNKLQLQLNGEKSDLPTDERLKNVANGEIDLGLEKLLFDYGRYLLIASSRPGSLPANLQGIWNEHIRAPWNADYHLNINLQMNYWPANMTNLDELNVSLFSLVDEMVENGKTAAKKNYGCEGSFLPHATDIWATSFLRSKTAYWGASFGAGAWMMQHYWNHYLYTQDRNFLKKQAFPALQEVAKFYSGWLIEHPSTGYLVSAPSSSPENSFFTPTGEKAALCLGSAKDQQVIKELFTNYLSAAKILKTENAWTTKIRQQLAKLRPGVQLGNDGRILEWDQEYKEVEPGHRHMSHLYAFHPGNEITFSETPELVEAVKKSMTYRMDHGGGHTGWSRAWLINLQARLMDGDLAHENILLLLKKSIGYNLFDYHPPFQIDGNFGYTSGVAEMLIQSHEKGIIRILPALPSAWKSGSVSGLKARGNVEAAMEWNNNQLKEIRLLSPFNQQVKIIYQDQERLIDLKKGKELLLDGNLKEI